FTEACSARTTPKPRPPPTPTPRPNITFHTYKCPATYAEWYCLNDATCFSVKIGDEILYNCWCADGYMGPRCEYKEIDGSFLPTRPRIMMETASIASGATLAFIIVLILCLILYIRYKQNLKQKLAEQSNGNTTGIDTVDGFPPPSATLQQQQQYQERRPFGPHHTIPIPMAATLNR
ncbi:protein spitz-like, partial [Condylostylus longicornis]|uniref:protein spitz-like n=1 Tax=Condylostylus longicornis TaxID=2530218 RepID=UPI00244DB0EA